MPPYTTPTPDVYAVPGAGSIIDQINPATGRTCILGQTEAEVLAREPRAVRMTAAAWRAAAAARQATPITWTGTSAEAYEEMLGILPPAAWIGGAFLVGEAYDHCVTTGRPRFTAYWHRAGRYLVASRPLTVAELRAELAAIPAPK